jgi:hypothetical protein
MYFFYFYFIFKFKNINFRSTTRALPTEVDPDLSPYLPSSSTPTAVVGNDGGGLKHSIFLFLLYFNNVEGSIAYPMPAYCPQHALVR